MPQPPRPALARSRTRRHPARLLALAGLCLAATLAQANDRPFQVTRTAVMEDDEYVWSFESWGQRFGTVRGFSVEPEYTFAAGTSVQVELSRYLDRQNALSGQEAEVEFKHIFNHLARDGYGWGLSLALNTSRSQDEGRRRGVGLKAPLSVALGDSGALLHLNLGLNKETDSRRQWVSALVLERELFRRTQGFVELAREGSSQYAQLGVRHWLKKEKLALDLALQQHRGDGVRASGFILGLGFYDL